MSKSSRGHRTHINSVDDTPFIPKTEIPSQKRQVFRAVLHRQQLTVAEANGVKVTVIGHTDTAFAVSAEIKPLYKPR
jgi:hypothetical protein